MTELTLVKPEMPEGVSLTDLLVHTGSKKLPLLAAVEIVRQTTIVCMKEWASGQKPLVIEPDALFLLNNGKVLLKPREVSSSGKFSVRRRYQSPEVKGGGERTEAADVYGLSAILFEMVTGNSVMNAVLHSPLTSHIPEPKTLNGDISDALNSVIFHGVQFDVDMRTFDLTSFLDGLNEAIVPGIECEEALRQCLFEHFPHLEPEQETQAHLKLMPGTHQDTEEKTVRFDARPSMLGRPTATAVTRGHDTPSFTFRLSQWIQRAQSFLKERIFTEALRQSLARRLENRRQRLIAAGIAGGFVLGLVVLCLALPETEDAVDSNISLSTFSSSRKLLDSNLFVNPQEGIVFSETKKVAKKEHARKLPRKRTRYSFR